MSKQTINIGASPNDGTGTPLRTSFDYTNQNFTELYTAVGPSGNNIVVPGNATITGDLTVDTSTLKVDSTNNRVGIGTASPSQPLHVRFDNAGPTTLALFENAIVDFSSSAAGQIVVGARGYNNTVLRQNPDIGTTPTIGGVLDTILANTYVAAGQGKVILATQSTARLTVHESSGDVSIANGNVVMATSGKGIDFSATAGTGTSELLNDYEEGTWTGTLKGSVSNPTVAVTATGKYTKVGRQVTVNISYNNVSTVGASGNVTIDGLPFNGPDNFAGSSIAFDLFAISTTLASWNAGTEIEFFITGAYVKATHNPGTGRYLTTTITYNA